MNASAWQQAKAALQAIESLEPDYRDSAELLVRVDRAQLAALYEEALGHMAAGAWRQAEIALKAVQRIDPAYLETGALLTRVSSELAQLPEHKPCSDPEAVDPEAPTIRPGLPTYPGISPCPPTQGCPDLAPPQEGCRSSVQPDGRFIVTVSAEGRPHMGCLQWAGVSPCAAPRARPSAACGL